MKARSPLQLVFLIFMLLSKFILAQETIKNIAPLYKYLQDNADSTIVLTYNQDFLHPVRHFIISKKSDIVTLYLYESPYDWKRRTNMPVNVRNFFQKREFDINRLQIDTNSFFNAKYVKPKKAKILWQKTMKYRPWQISDDTVDGEGCPIIGDRKYSIFDGVTMKLFLITNNNIKQLRFYAPDFYNEKCPGRSGRLNILKIEQMFKEYFERP